MEHPPKMNIKQWAEEDRPREKMLTKGMSALSDAELLAILIGSGNTNETAVELSKRILSENKNNLNELARMSISALCKQFKGIGTAKAVSIAAALELGRRRKDSEEIERPQIRTSGDVYRLFAPILADLPHEEMWIATLNQACRVIGTHKISPGGISGTVVDVQMVIRYALDKHATQLILTHNHPSGNNTPSEQDRRVTKKIKSAAELFDIKLLDHVIIAREKKYSFADEGEI